MKQVTSAIATFLKRISRMHAILLWRVSDDSLKFDNSSVSAFANNADMRVCSCVCVSACVYVFKNVFV